ncbi:AT-rich interactive domain-containing protein 2 [Capsicum chacoense]|uniref:ELM2 domain-containing protein n=1 Tax=Capsicum annuum TaxID=4072 RepID=A0A1U8H2M9_CAPAN|nr:AT-rich interactive domain-containing protein 2 [Capsicum annuum]KAF3673432.1 putative serine/threonine-protein kinase-like [Capsicum annuum]PHT80254.1 hypothetical protein T459_18306 [Capsicum annuum]
MKNAKKNPDPTLTSEKKKEWLDFIYEDRNKCVIPVGPRFQADIPDWTHSQKVQMVRQYKENKADTSKWLGTPMWPANNNLANKKVNEKLIGKGRDEHCRCESPGSVECVKSHVKEERMKLKSELGRAFSAWKFDEMGEEVSNLWTNKEQRIFTSLVQMNRMSKGKSFMKPALTYLPSKNRQSIVNYYFNVHVPQRISSQTRSNCHIIDTDDEEGEEEEEDEEEFNTSKRSQKRNRAQKGDSSGSKPVKRKYLSGRR